MSAVGAIRPRQPSTQIAEPQRKSPPLGRAHLRYALRHPASQLYCRSPLHRQPHAFGPSERNPRIPITTNSKPNTELNLLDGGLMETNLDHISRRLRAGQRWQQYHAQDTATHCATHKIRRNRHEIRIFRYISSGKIRLKLSQLKERHHDGHDI